LVEFDKLHATVWNGNCEGHPFLAVKGCSWPVFNKMIPDI